MLRALGLAVSDLGNGRILAILLQALAVSVLVFIVIAGLLVWLLSGSDPCGLVGMDSCPLDTGTGAIGAVALTLLAAWFLFPAVAIGVITTFTDRIASAVEDRHYPQAAAEARPIGIGRGAAMGLKSAGRLILFNLKDHRIVQMLNHFYAVERQGEVHLHNGQRYSRRTVTYQLPESWSIVP